MMKKPNGYWTKERLIEEAKKYISRKEMYEKCIGGYSCGKKKKIIDLMFKDHVNNGLSIIDKPNGYWNFSRCKEEAKKYKTISEFLKNNTSAYQSARRKKWVYRICGHMNHPYKKRGYWTEERCVISARKCKTIKELRSKFPSAYYKILKKYKHLNLFKHMAPLTNIKTRYIYLITYKKLAYIGIAYNPEIRKKEHKTKSNNKYLRELKTHRFKVIDGPVDEKKAQKLEGFYMKKYKLLGYKILNIAGPGGLGSKRGYSNKALYSAAKKYKSRKILYKNFLPIYRAALNRGLLDKIFEDLPNKGYTRKTPLGYYNFNKCLELSRQCKTRSEFHRRFIHAYNSAHRKNWLDKLFKNHENDGYTFKKLKDGTLTIDYCQLLANKCKDRDEFSKKHKGAYSKSCRKDWLETLFKNHVNKGFSKRMKFRGYWNFETCKIEALKYKNRSQFRIHASQAYKKSYKNGWIDSFFNLSSGRKFITT